MDAKVGTIIKLLTELRVGAVRQEVQLAAAQADYKDLVEELDSTRKRRVEAEERLEKFQLEQLIPIQSLYKDTLEDFKHLRNKRVVVERELEQLRLDLEKLKPKRIRPTPLSIPSNTTQWSYPNTPFNTPKTPETEENPWLTTKSFDTHSGLEKYSPSKQRRRNRTIVCDCSGLEDDSDGVSNANSDDIERLERARNID